MQDVIRTGERNRAREEALKALEDSDLVEEAFQSGANDFGVSLRQYLRERWEPSVAAGMFDLFGESSSTAGGGVTGEGDRGRGLEEAAVARRRRDRGKMVVR